MGAGATEAVPRTRRGSRRQLISAQALDRLYSTNLLRQLMDVSVALNQRLLQASAANGHRGLKMSFAAVMAQAGFGNARLSDIAAMNGTTKQAISQTARELSDLGYIRLLPDPEDRRARIIVLTERGSELIADSLRSIDTIRAQAAELIGDEKLAILEAVIGELWLKLGERQIARLTVDE